MRTWIPALPRLQLFEIHDQAWCPSGIRDGATDCLKLFAVVGRQFAGVIQPLEVVLTATGDRYIVDLGAGSGGPWLGLYDAFTDSVPTPIIVLTDLSPNRPAMAQARARTRGRIQYVQTPIDARAVPDTLPGLRTLFTSFHHFEPGHATAILQDAVDTGQAIAIFEQTRRSLIALLFMLVLAPLAFLGVPLIRPFRWSRIFWTYIIPAIPAVLLFDGMVSCLRTYTRDELRIMTDELQGQSYTWTYGEKRTVLSPLGMTYLVGYPSASDDVVGPRVAGTN